MKELSQARIKEILEKHNARDPERIEKEKILEDLQEYVNKKAVLGFDIYRYSQYPPLEQTLIPHLFKELYNSTIINCLDLEPYIFANKDKKYFDRHFIDSGDGGFQIFENPLQALVFAIYFQANIKRYGSRHEVTYDLFNTIGEITLRYSLTYENIYSYRDNYYGPSIINCARIMGKDKLNRFLIDENALDWFNEELNGIENIQVINIEEDFQKIDFFRNIEIKEEARSSLLFNELETKILRLDILRIGEIRSKLDIISIHSLHTQVMMITKSTKDFKKFTISLGNLNSSGLTD